MHKYERTSTDIHAKSSAPHLFSRHDNALHVNQRVGALFHSLIRLRKDYGELPVTTAKL